MVSTLGESGSAVIQYYGDISIILKDPEMFQELLRKIFAGSNAGSNLLEDKIKKALASLLEEIHSVKIPVSKWKDKAFRQFILGCKRQFEVSKF